MKRKLIALFLCAALLLAAFPVGANAGAADLILGVRSVMPYRLGCDVFRYIPQAAKWMDNGLYNPDPLVRSGYTLLYTLLWPFAMVVNGIVGLFSRHACGVCVPDYDVPVTLQSENLARGAAITAGGKGAEHLLEDNSNKKCWIPAGEGAYAEIQLTRKSTFNLAVIEKIGSQVQYFHLQAWVGGDWQDIYRSEKIQRQRLCGFEPVTTGRVRLVIDKIRGGNVPVRIKSISLYNEPKRTAADFQTAIYQRMDGDVPSEVLARGGAYADTFARFYDVYNTVIIFQAVNWNENGDMTFTKGEDFFARELAALKEIIARRSNPHDVKIVVTTLPDGAFGNGQENVHPYMALHWRDVADQMVEFFVKYDLDGMDIDWEFPRTADDWRCYDNFVARLDDGMKAVKPGAILSAALSAWGLGMAPETLARFDQIQYMAYDGFDEDGFHSGLHAAQAGLADFAKRGADISKINIGIGAYGRTVDRKPNWPLWRDQQDVNYWDCKYYCVAYGMEATYCSPAVAGDKAAYALFTGAGGVMVFVMASDRLMDDPASVAGGLENALKRYTASIAGGNVCSASVHGNSRSILWVTGALSGWRSRTKAGSTVSRCACRARHIIFPRSRSCR